MTADKKLHFKNFLSPDDDLLSTSIRAAVSELTA